MNLNYLLLENMFLSVLQMSWGVGITLQGLQFYEDHLWILLEGGVPRGSWHPWRQGAPEGKMRVGRNLKKVTKKDSASSTYTPGK